ncbi:hypothetical protein AB0H86_08070 [Streptomyces sp. NPDC050997]|uniref:hypothetical protein n=1 Tax=Streptomyces sp. NPDC050997 TaxID=3155519 RepID=UPI003440B41F
MNRRTTNDVTLALSPITFGLPRASAIRSAAAPPEIGGLGIAARIASASSASTADLPTQRQDVHTLRSWKQSG